MATVEQPALITSLPLTAEAREKFLVELFHDEIPHLGELFVPGNSFYIHGSSHAKARHMVAKICEWLGIKPGYIGLEFESQPDANVLGHRYTIFVESHVVRNEMLLGATLAHALTRYLLEERKQIQLTDAYEQLSLAATGTIVFGLGVVVANGLQPGRGHETDNQSLLGNVPVSEYGTMLHGFLWQRAVPAHAIANNVAPWTARLLGMSIGKRPITALRQLNHTERQKKFQKLALGWVIIVLLIVGGFVLSKARNSDNSSVQELHEKVRLYESLVKSCNSAVTYTKQYSDLSDIQTQRAVNSEELRCLSLENQRKSAQNEFEAVSQ